MAAFILLPKPIMITKDKQTRGGIKDRGTKINIMTGTWLFCFLYPQSR